MIDLAKISCKLHPNEYINLFCAQSTLKLMKIPAGLDFARPACANIPKCMSPDAPSLSTKT